MKNLSILSLIIIICPIFQSCYNEENGFDASGSFEATEVIVSAEAQGKIISLALEEGEEISSSSVIGLIDTTQLYLTLQQIEASRAALQESKPNVKLQIEATQREIEKYEFEKQRIQKLLEGDAATQKQLDDINSMLSVLNARLTAQKNSLNVNINSIEAQRRTLEVQKELTYDQLQKCRLVSPVQGTVLAKYAEEGEIVRFGSPLFSVADLSEIYLRAYVSGAQLSEIKLGQKVTVLFDGKDEDKEREGKISWISSKAEFTPKFVQTKEERVNLVYAIKVKVNNDGAIKIGMPGEVIF